MIQSFRLVHFIPGRLRVISPHLKGNREIQIQIQQIAKHFSVIERVEINSTVGSILLRYDVTDKQAIKRLLIQAQLSGFIPGDIDVDLLGEVLCGTVTPKDGLHKLGISKNSGDRILKNFITVSPTTNYLQEMTPQTIYFVGLRTLLSALNPIPIWFDYLWVGYSSLTALNHVTGKDMTD